MEEIIKEIKNNRNLRDTSLKIYSRIMNNIFTDFNTEPSLTNLEFLEDIEKVEEYLKDFTQSKKKIYLAVILILLSPKGKRQPIEKYRDLYIKYTNLLDEQQQIYLSSIKNNRKTEKTAKNWMNWDDILKKRDSLKKKLKKFGYNYKSKKLKEKKDLILLKKFVILSLYTLLPPRRLCYATMKIIDLKKFKSLDDFDKNNNNYLVIKSNKRKFFHYGKNANKSQMLENHQIKIKSELNNIINMYLTFRNKNNDWFLQNNYGKKMTKNNLTLYLNKIFLPKKISVSILRKSFLSSQFTAQTKLSHDLALAMNHSPNIQQQIYVKG